ncbi:MAG TPA: hypothetical protein VFL69_09265 [Marmoricola sp.]|nr:hypothetical protein [Marmoricola sp.]
MSRSTLEDTRAWVRDLVRSGLLAPDALEAEVTGAVATDHPELPAAETARSWIAEERAAWAADAQAWPVPTDHDRLQAAFARLEQHGIEVLQGCADHWVARDLLRRRGDDPPRGVAWFTPPDVWHAIDEGMLEVNLWHGTTANAAPGDELLDEAIGCFAAEGLPAHFDEGRIEVSAHWRRRPGDG